MLRLTRDRGVFFVNPDKVEMTFKQDGRTNVTFTGDPNNAFCLVDETPEQIIAMRVFWEFRFVDYNPTQRKKNAICVAWRADEDEGGPVLLSYEETLNAN